MSKRFTALLLRVAFSVELENVPNGVLRIGRAIARHYKPAMHTNRAIAFVIITKESADELVERLRPTLEGIGLLENYWCHTAAPDVAARHGAMDPLVSAVAAAWKQVRQLNQAQDVKDAKRLKSGKRSQDAVSRAPIQVSIKGSGPGQSTKKPYGKKPPAYRGPAFGSIEEGIVQITREHAAKLDRRAEWDRKHRRDFEGE